MPSPDSRRAFWSIPADQLLGELQSSTTGLSSAEAARRLARHGPNVAAPRRRASQVGLFASQFTSPITALLLIAAVLSLIVGERVDGTIILGILLVSAVLGFWQEHRASGAVARLLALIRTTVTVVRDGRPLQVPIEEVVPGDVVQLVAGASIPGDARILESNDLYVDQAALTGESFPAEKAPGTSDPDATLMARTNVVYMGTHVVSGTATALVAQTGRDTEFGAIARRLALRPPETEFERGVRRFGYLLLEIATVLLVVIFAVNVWRDRPVLDALLFTLALAVGLVPQLLPAIVSVTLSHGAGRMAAQRVIVRRLAAIEDLGGMEVLCTDKTGTVTQGAVALQGAEDWHGHPSERVRLWAHLNAAFESGFPNPIDDALRADSMEAAQRYSKVDEIPYDFARKRLSVAVTDGTQRLLITKGALSQVLAICDRVEDASGHVTPLEEARAAIDQRFQALSREGYRVLGVGYRVLAGDKALGRADESGLTFVGMLSLADPLKPRAHEALTALAELGIAVKLVTGDNRHVAMRVASNAGIDTRVVVTGGDLQHMSEAALVQQAPAVGVFAEVEPSQKERIIRALRKGGRAVGYLGDGINDAPALHAADIGISVDSATDVTKQAADVILLEKDLNVLSNGVREGRRAFANTLKYIFITTSANFGNMFSMAGASVLSAFLPLLPKQILLINVLTDLPAMAIAADRLDPELVRQPRRWDNRSIRRFMVSFGLISSLFDFLTFATLLLLQVPATVFRTAWFTESILSEVLILLVIRTRRRFFQSSIGGALRWISLAVAVFTLVLPYTALATPLGFAPLPREVLALVLGIVVAYVAVSEASKRTVLRWASL